MFKSRIKKWYTKNPKDANYMLMDNGLLNVPDSDLSEFHKIYIECIHQNQNLSVCEKLGKYVYQNFFVDVDIKHLQSGSHDIRKLSLQIAGMMENPIIYYCEELKGSHIVSNEKLMNKECIEKAKLISKSIGLSDTDIIDTSVYNTGLRMLGSYKVSKLNYIKRSYLPQNVCRTRLSISDLEASLIRRGKCTISQMSLSSTAEICGFCNEPENALLKLFSQIHLNYSNMRLLSKKTFTRSGSKIISYSTDSKFCTNKNDFHKSCNIKFEIYNKKCYQKCWCPCNIKRYHGLCKNFKSKPVLVPLSLMSVLSNDFS